MVGPLISSLCIAEATQQTDRSYPDTPTKCIHLEAVRLSDVLGSVLNQRLAALHRLYVCRRIDGRLPARFGANREGC